MRGAAFDSPLRTAAGHQAVDEPRRERIAAADPVEDLEVRPRRRVEEVAARPADRRPVIHRRALRMTQRRRHDSQVGKFTHDLADHPLEPIEVEIGVLTRDPRHLESQRGGKIFLVADQHVDERHETPVDRNRARVATERAPQRFTIVEIERHGCAVTPRRLHGFTRHLRRRVGERAEDAAGVQPARALAVEDAGPIDVARAELRDRGVAPVRAADPGANAEAALDEVQPVPALAADAVVLSPDHV